MIPYKKQTDPKKKRRLYDTREVKQRGEKKPRVFPEKVLHRGLPYRREGKATGKEGTESTGKREKKGGRRALKERA